MSSGPLNPEDTIRLLEQRGRAINWNWESILARQYRAALVRPRTIVDVGAHAGQHLGNFVKMGALRVVAFEPIADLAAALVRKFASDRVVVHQTALGAKAGPSAFALDRTVPSESGLRARADKTEARQVVTIDVTVATLDQFALPDVDYIKLDIEGGELDALAGGRETLAMWRPLISIEYGRPGYSSYGHSKRSLLEWANAQRYLVTDLFGSPFDERAYARCVDRYYWDYFLVPQEAAEVQQRLHVSGLALLMDRERFWLR
jgi:FkbM family methyltransferase